MDRISLGTRKVSIEFPGVKALNQVDFEVSTGEIRAVVGANGAGKSTLMKVLFGLESSQEGKIYIEGKEVHITSPLDAIACWKCLHQAENVERRDAKTNHIELH